MAVSRPTESWLSGTDPVPDPGFRIVFGSYVGVVAVEALLAAALWFEFDDAGVLALAGMAVFTVAGLAGGAAVGWWRHGPERIGRSRLRHGFVLPGLVVVALQGIAWLLDVGDILSVGLLLVSLAATVFGALIALMVRTRYVAARCSASEARVSWEGRLSRRSQLQMALLILPGGLLIIAIEPELWTSVIVGSVGGLLGSLYETHQTVTIHDAGVSVEKDLNRELFPWDQFDGYRLTDSTLVLERGIRPDIRWKRADIEDEEAVTDTLDDYLDG